MIQIYLNRNLRRIHRSICKIHPLDMFHDHCMWQQDHTELQSNRNYEMFAFKFREQESTHGFSKKTDNSNNWKFFNGTYLVYIFCMFPYTFSMSSYFCTCLSSKAFCISQLKFCPCRRCFQLNSHFLKLRQEKQLHLFLYQQQFFRNIKKPGGNILL